MLTFTSRTKTPGVSPLKTSFAKKRSGKTGRVGIGKSRGLFWAATKAPNVTRQIKKKEFTDTFILLLRAPLVFSCSFLSWRAVTKKKGNPTKNQKRKTCFTISSSEKQSD